MKTLSRRMNAIEIKAVPDLWRLSLSNAIADDLFPMLLYVQSLAKAGAVPPIPNDINQQIELLFADVAGRPVAEDELQIEDFPRHCTREMCLVVACGALWDTWEGTPRQFRLVGGQRAAVQCVTEDWEWISPGASSLPESTKIRLIRRMAHCVNTLIPDKTAPDFNVACMAFINEIEECIQMVRDAVKQNV